MPFKARNKNRRSISLWSLLVVMALQTLAISAFAQEKTAVQIKAFDEKLKAVPDIEISINGGGFVAIGKRGVGFTDISTRDLPPVSIAVKDDELEVASWNYSRGVLEVVVRKKSYRLVPFRLQTIKGEILKNTEVSYLGKDTIKLHTDGTGGFSVPVPHEVAKPGISQFRLKGFNVEKLTTSGRETILVVAPVQRAAQTPVVAKDASQYFQDFDLRNLDSIRSLTVFYAIFKNYDFSKLDKVTRDRIDGKLYSLMGKMLDSIKVETEPVVTRISDSTFVSDDIRTLLHQAETEQITLAELRLAFDEKIALINRKVQSGIGDLDPAVRNQLWQDIVKLEQILKENEMRFYRNQSDYHTVLASMKERFFDVTELEEKLFMSESQRMEEQARFRRNILITAVVSIVFAALCILLIHFSNRLRKKQGELVEANDHIRKMNENLETLVYQRTAMLEKTHREMDMFLYKASHDLQGPISSIIGLCNLATHTVNEESRELVQRTYNTAFSMERMLKKLKVISEISRPAEPKRVNLHEELTMLHAMFRQKIRDNEVRFTIDCDPSISLVAHRDLLHTTLVNLVENAIHFSVLKKEGPPEVTLKCTPQANSLQITIVDNGVGIPEESREKVWDMFYVANEQSTGNGLGLYIVRKCVQVMNGYVSLESRENRYTRIVVVIPAAIVKTQASAGVQPAMTS